MVKAVHPLVKVVHPLVKAAHPLVAGENMERVVNAVHPLMAGLDVGLLSRAVEILLPTRPPTTNTYHLNNGQASRFKVLFYMQGTCCPINERTTLIPTR